MQDKVKNKKNKNKKKTKVQFDSKIEKVEPSDGIIDEKYVEFGKLKSELARNGAKNPGALAAYIGRRKYGTKKFQNASEKDERLNEVFGMYTPPPVKGTLDQSPNHEGDRVVVNLQNSEYHLHKGIVTFSNSKGLHHVVKLDGKERPVGFLGKHLVQIKEERIEEKMSHSKKYTVNVVVSDPNHQVLSKRDDLMNRRVRISANSEKNAHERAREFYKKKRFEIHDSHVISEENQLDEAIRTSKEYVFTHKPGDEESEKRLAILKQEARSRNKSGDHTPNFRWTVERRGRLGKNNPKAKDYCENGKWHIRLADAPTQDVYVREKANYKKPYSQMKPNETIKDLYKEGNSLEQLASKRAKHEDAENRYDEKAEKAENRAERARDKRDYGAAEWHDAVTKKYTHKTMRHGQAINVIDRLLKKKVNESVSLLDESAAKIKKALNDNGVHPDTVGKTKNGEYVTRREFFYSNGHDSSKEAQNVSDALNKAGIKHTITDHRKHWKSFRGGASTRNSSHWAVHFRVHEQ